MPWSLSKREGKWCVVKADGEVEGCHSSRTDAIKQQRALYANESRMASLYTELDAVTEEYVEELDEPARESVETYGQPVALDSTLSPFAAELVGLILKDEREKSLTASLAQSMDAISERMMAEREERSALVAALGQIGNPVINVQPADVQVNVPTPEITVEAAQIHLPAPEVTVQAAPTPNITVRPEINLPAATKTITFERDFDGRVTKADVVEASE